MVCSGYSVYPWGLKNGTNGDISVNKRPIFRFISGSYTFFLHLREFGMDVCTLLHLKWITNKDLLYSTGNLVYVIWQPGREGHLGENGCVCG